MFWYPPTKLPGLLEERKTWFRHLSLLGVCATNMHHRHLNVCDSPLTNSSAWSFTARIFFTTFRMIVSVLKRLSPDTLSGRDMSTYFTLSTHISNTPADFFLRRFQMKKWLFLKAYIDTKWKKPRNLVPQFCPPTPHSPPGLHVK